MITVPRRSRTPRLAIGLMAGVAVAALLATNAAKGQAVAEVSGTSPNSSKGGVHLGALSKRDFFKVPDAALVRPLGDIAPNQGTPFPVPFKGTPGLGIPLGGMGAGSFMINQSGTFGPWSFNGSPKARAGR